MYLPARGILDNLNAGISGGIGWNLLLDAKGGPSHAGDFREVPVTLNKDGSDFHRWVFVIEWPDYDAEEF